MKELLTIQSRLKAPKGQFNSFGKYHYRSAEDILQAAKPLLSEQGCTLVITDTIEMLGGRFYVRATATIMNSQGASLSADGWAREDDAKKGMDGSQVTGAASSYARKYALGGLFAIDDTKDADALPPAQPAAPPTKEEALAAVNAAKDNASLTAAANKYMAYFATDTDFIAAGARRRGEIAKGGAA